MVNALDIEVSIRTGLRNRPVRLSDNVMLLIDDPEYMVDVWLALRDFESEIMFQRKWLLHEHALRARGVWEYSKIRGSRPAVDKFRDTSMPMEVRIQLEGFHNYLRTRPCYADVLVYIPDITAPNEIPEWDGNRYDYGWIYNMKTYDPDYGVLYTR